MAIVMATGCAHAPPRTTVAPPARAAGSAAPVAPMRKVSSDSARPPADVLATMGAARREFTAVEVGPAQLTIGGPSLQPAEVKTIEVDWLEDRGSDVRVGIRLDKLVFAVWIARSRVLGIISREVAVSDMPHGYLEAPLEVTLKTGARVRRLAKKQGFTQVRYLETMQVEGWVPDDAIGDRTDTEHALYPGYGRASTLFTPGVEIRTEARWGTRVLAVGRYSFVVDVLQKLTDGWMEVQYDDSDLRVHGFASQYTAPGAYRVRRESEPLPPLATNANVPAGTCLYAGDEVIGFVTHDVQGVVDPGPRAGWSSVTLDTPWWGAVTFDARGADASLLEKCAP